MMRVGVISDTHGVLRDQVVEVLSRCEVIIHGGDIGNVEILERLQELGEVYVVRGNNDKENWCDELPEILRFQVGGLRILLIHDAKHLKGMVDLSQVDLVVCGHSHRYRDEVDGHVRYLNPGSCGVRRFGLPLTMVVMEIEEEKSLMIEQINLKNN